MKITAFHPGQKLLTTIAPAQEVFYIGSVQTEIGPLHVVRLPEKGRDSWNHTDGYMLFNDTEVVAAPTEA